LKRTVFTVIIMLILVIFLASCGWKVEIVDPTEQIENEQKIESGEEQNYSGRIIKEISAEKTDTSVLTKKGLGYGIGSQIPFQWIDEEKALVFSYYSEDPFVGESFSVKIFLFDSAKNEISFIKEATFSNSCSVSVYSKGDEAKVVFGSKLFAYIISINTETLEISEKNLEYPGFSCSPNGTFAKIMEGFIEIGDVENPEETSELIKIGENYEIISWSPDSEYILLQNESSGSDYLICNIKTGNMVYFHSNGIKKWCGEKGFFVFTDYDEETGKTKSGIIDLETGETEEREYIESAVLYEKEFIIYRENNDICVKEHSTGKIHRIENVLDGRFYYTAENFNFENSSVVLASYGVDEADFRLVKIEWEE